MSPVVRKSVFGVPFLSPSLGLKLIAWLPIKYSERNRNVYLGKVCAQLYTMKTRGNESTFSKNERKCAATVSHVVSAGLEPTQDTAVENIK